jgi:O-antigen/teichoic acid export membrane protein
MQIAMTITNAVLVWTSCGWRPGKPLKSSGVRSMLAFGGNLTGFRLVNYFSRNLDNILIGRYWGSQELGLYAKAYQLVLLPIQQINNPVNNVALPALCSLQDDPEKYCRYYYKAILLISTLGMPIVCFMFAAADKVILLMLGEQWLGVVPIFRFLMPAALNATIGIALGWAFQSLGHVDRQLRWGVFASITNAIIFLIGVRWGAIGVAAGYGLSRPVFLVVAFAYCYQGTFLKLTDLINTLYRPALSSTVAAIIVVVANTLFLNKIHLFVSLLTSIFIYTVFYFGTWIILPNGWNTLLNISQLIKFLKQRK